MAEILFEHDGCDGWAIYDSQYIDAKDARNIHVVEGNVTNEAGEIHFRPNTGLATVCGKNLKRQGRAYTFCSKDPSEIRSKLAEFQNQGYEVCGTCVSRFYADPE